jgi:capsule polysaccharide export protein KpsE/RkpR
MSAGGNGTTGLRRGTTCWRRRHRAYVEAFYVLFIDRVQIGVDYVIGISTVNATGTAIIGCC